MIMFKAICGWLWGIDPRSTPALIIINVKCHLGYLIIVILTINYTTTSEVSRESPLNLLFYEDPRQRF